ncbi:hypothetical protein R7X75_02270 [Mesomycoplasma ovipneumoniae]|nr:hypothetical protein [Mesomycoplasma ovipneumoniae]
MSKNKWIFLEKLFKIDIPEFPVWWQTLTFSEHKYEKIPANLGFLT